MRQQGRWSTEPNPTPVVARCQHGFALDMDCAHCEIAVLRAALTIVMADPKNALAIAKSALLSSGKARI